jgi:hypothetical protein
MNKKYTEFSFSVLFILIFLKKKHITYYLIINISSVEIELQQMITNYVDFWYNWGTKTNEDKCFFVSFGYYNNHYA